MDGVVVEQKKAEHVRGDCVDAAVLERQLDFCEHLFHFDSCICTLLFDKYKKGYNRRLIEYGHLVLGTRSAAKFEQVPSSSILLLHFKLPESYDGANQTSLYN